MQPTCILYQRWLQKTQMCSQQPDEDQLLSPGPKDLGEPRKATLPMEPRGLEWMSACSTQATSSSVQMLAHSPLQTEDHTGTRTSGGAQGGQPNVPCEHQAMGNASTELHRPHTPPSASMSSEHANRGLAEQQAPNQCGERHRAVAYLARWPDRKNL